MNHGKMKYLCTPTEEYTTLTVNRNFKVIPSANGFYAVSEFCSSTDIFEQRLYFACGY